MEQSIFMKIPLPTKNKQKEIQNKKGVAHVAAPFFLLGGRCTSRKDYDTLRIRGIEAKVS